MADVSVLVPTLAEDVTSNCLYYIKSRNITSVNLSAGQTGGHCSYSYPIESPSKHYNVSLHINYVYAYINLDSRLAIDDTGIYLVARYRNQKFPLTYYKFNNNENDDIGFMGVTESTIPSHILTTSPGTQPLPSKRKYTYTSSFLP